MRLVLAVVVLVLAGCGDPEAKCTLESALNVDGLPSGTACEQASASEIVCFWQTTSACAEYVTIPTASAECVPSEAQTLCLVP